MAWPLRNRILKIVHHFRGQMFEFHGGTITTFWNYCRCSLSDEILATSDTTTSLTHCNGSFFAAAECLSMFPCISGGWISVESIIYFDKTRPATPGMTRNRQNFTDPFFNSDPDQKIVDSEQCRPDFNCRLHSSAPALTRAALGGKYYPSHTFSIA